MTRKIFLTLTIIATSIGSCNGMFPPNRLETFASIAERCAVCSLGISTILAVTGCRILSEIYLSGMPMDSPYAWLAWTTTSLGSALVLNAYKFYRTANHIGGIVAMRGYDLQVVIVHTDQNYYVPPNATARISPNTPPTSNGLHHE